MTIYNSLQALASGLLKEFKQGSISLIKITDGTGPADNPGSPVETIYSLDATASGVSDKYLENTFIMASDIEVTAAVLSGVTISDKDQIQIDGNRYKIIKDASVPSAGTKVAWKFIVRRGG